MTAGSTNENYLSVGAGVELAAKIERCSRIYVAGNARLQSTCKSFVLDAGGRVEGSVECETAEVRGRFEGELRASQRLIVHDTGQIEGDIHYSRIEVADGARLTGRIETLAGPTADSLRGGAESYRVPAGATA